MFALRSYCYQKWILRPEINLDGSFQVFKSNLFVCYMFVNLDLFAQFLKEVCKSSNTLVADLWIWTLFAQCWSNYAKYHNFHKIFCKSNKIFGFYDNFTHKKTDFKKISWKTTPSMLSDINRLYRKFSLVSGSGTEMTSHAKFKMSIIAAKKEILTWNFGIRQDFIFWFRLSKNIMGVCICWTSPLSVKCLRVGPIYSLHISFWGFK